MKKLVFISTVIIVLIASFASCKHESFVTPANPNPVDSTDTTIVPGPTDTGICFERDILPIFISNCAKSGCHDAASAEKGYVFTGYITITQKKFEPGSPDECELYEAITEDDEDKIMPPPPNQPLSASQIDLIRRWIKEGAPNSTGCSSGCDTAVFTYSAVIQPVMNTYCRGCHNTAIANGGFNFETYNGVLNAVAAGSLLPAIRHESGYTAMPQGGNKLPDCRIRQFEKWVASGAPNN